MIRNFYLLLLLAFPFIICYEYDSDREQDYRPKIYRKVKTGQRYNAEEHQENYRSNFEGSDYSDDEEPMAQLDLAQFLKKSDDYFDDNVMPKQMEFNIPYYTKNKRGIFTKNNHERRENLKDLKLSKDSPQFVSVDKVNPNRLKYGKNLPATHKKMESVSDFSYEEDNLYGNRNIHLNINDERNINGEERNPQSRNANENSDSFYDAEIFLNANTNNKKGRIGNNYIDKQSKETEFKVDSNVINENGNMKIHKMITPRNYKLVAFDGSARQKSSLRKQNADAVYQDEDVTTSTNINDKRKGIKRLRIPFFYHDKSDTKRNKKRKLFCGCNCKKKTILTTTKPIYGTEVSTKIIKLLKRSNEEKLCPMCRMKSTSGIKSTDKDSPVIHNSRQFFKTLSITKEDLQELDHGLNKDEETESTQDNQNDNEEPGEDKVKASEDEASNQSSRSKREQSTFDRDRQLKELDEVQRKVDGVQIKGIEITK